MSSTTRTYSGSKTEDKTQKTAMGTVDLIVTEGTPSSAQLIKLVTDPPSAAMKEYLSKNATAENWLNLALLGYHSIYRADIANGMSAADALKKHYHDRLEKIKDFLTELYVCLLDGTVQECPPDFPADMLPRQKAAAATCPPQISDVGAKVLEIGRLRNREILNTYALLATATIKARQLCQDQIEPAAEDFFRKNLNLAEVIVDLTELCEPTSGVVDVNAITGYVQQLSRDFTSAAYMYQHCPSFVDGTTTSETLFRSLRSFQVFQRNPNSQLFLMEGKNAAQLLLALNQVNPKLNPKLCAKVPRSKTPAREDKAGQPATQVRPSSGSKKRSPSQEKAKEEKKQ